MGFYRTLCGWFTGRGVGHHCISVKLHIAMNLQAVKAIAVPTHKCTEGIRRVAGAAGSRRRKLCGRKYNFSGIGEGDFFLNRTVKDGPIQVNPLRMKADAPASQRQPTVQIRKIKRKNSVKHRVLGGENHPHNGNRMAFLLNGAVKANGHTNGSAFAQRGNQPGTLIDIGIQGFGLSVINSQCAACSICQRPGNHCSVICCGICFSCKNLALFIDPKVGEVHLNSDI